MAPLDILEPEGADLSTTYSIGSQELNNGEVASTDGAFSVNLVKDLLDILVR